jgi:hypothetical protein
MANFAEISVDILTGHPVWTALALVLSLLLAVYLYYRTNPPLSTGIRMALGALRFIAIMALFMALFEPVLSYTREYERKPRLTLLLDKSGSMKTSEGGRTRQERMREFLDSENFRKFAGNFDIRTYYFGGNLTDDAANVDSLATALGEVLSELQKKEAARLAEAWLLISDGINNRGLDVATASDHLVTPVYALGVGSDFGLRDVTVAGLEYNRAAFVGKPTEIMVRLQWSGLNNEPIMVQIKDGSKVLAADTLRGGPGDLKQDISITFVPDRIGRQTFLAEITRLTDEVNTDNNARSFSMLVLKSRLNVLLVADHLDWEYAFLKRFLMRSENVELSTVVYRSNGQTLEGRFPTTQTELNQADMIIFYDIKSELLSAQESIIHSFVAEKGGGVFFLLGDNYLGARPPRWVDNLLPFVSRRGQGQMIYSRFNGIPSENFLFHPSVRLSDDRRGVRERWRDLPNFERLVPMDSVTPHSEVLITAGLGRSDIDYPVLGYRLLGAGKILAATAAPFWRWAFLSVGFNEPTSDYDLFWDGSVKWLALKEDFDPIKIVPDKDIYTRGETVGFTAFVNDQGFRPIENARGLVELVSGTGVDTMTVQWLETGEGRYRAEFEAVSPGRYSYRGVVERDGIQLKEADGQLAVESYYVEDYDRRPDFAALETSARRSGGRYDHIDKADSVLAGISVDRISETVKSETSLWDRVWLLFIFIGALALEWTLRKRYQLI